MGGVRDVWHQTIVPFALRYGEPLGDDLPPEMQEAHAANRYLGMAQAVLEHVFFLHPGFLGEDLTFSLHPNSRVYLVKSEDRRAIKSFEALGFQSPATNLSRDNL